MTYRVFDGPDHPLSSRARLARALRDLGPRTPAELATLLLLDRQQVHNALHELEDMELAAPDDPDQPKTYHFLGEDQVVAAVDIGPHTIRIALCTLAGKVLMRTEEATDNTTEIHTRIDVFIGVLRHTLARAKVEASRLWGVSFAVPGTITDAGSIAQSLLLPDWSGIDMAKRITEVLGCPVVLGNDATLSAIAEASLGAGHLAHDFINVCVGRRLAVRPVIDGRPYGGANNLAGSVAHYYGDRIGALGQITWSDGGGPHVLERACAGDPAACAEVEHLVTGLAQGIALSVLHYNPQTIVVCGSIGSGLGPWQDHLARQIRHELDPLPVQVEIRFSPLGADTVIAGALVMALERATTAILGERMAGPTPDIWTTAAVGPRPGQG